MLLALYFLVESILLTFQGQRCQVTLDVSGAPLNLNVVPGNIVVNLDRYARDFEVSQNNASHHLIKYIK